MTGSFKKTHLAIAAALLAHPALSQTIPSTPVQSVTTEGIAYSLAFANNGYNRTQTIYESSQVYRPLQQWQTLYVRPDAGPFQRNFTAFQRDLTIRMSGRGVPSPELASQRSFQANHGTDLTTVLDKRPVSFPAFAQPGSGPADFLVPMPLDRPFPMLGVVHLLVEFETGNVMGGPSQYPWYADAEVWFGRPWTVIADTFGTGCGPQQTYYAQFDPGQSELQTQIAYARSPNGAMSDPAVGFVGTSDRQWGPFALPLPLVLLGAPGCSIYTDPAATWMGTTSGRGAARYTLEVPVPRDYSLLGKTVFSQTVVLDPTVNALGLRASPGARFLFSSPPDPYHALTLVRGGLPNGGTPGDEPDFVTPDFALVLGVQ